MTTTTSIGDLFRTTAEHYLHPTTGPCACCLHVDLMMAKKNNDEELENCSNIYSKMGCRTPPHLMVVVLKDKNGLVNSGWNIFLSGGI